MRFRYRILVSLWCFVLAAAAQTGVKAQGGELELLARELPVMQHLRLTLQPAGGPRLQAQLQAVWNATGRDQAGEYRLVRYALTGNSQPAALAGSNLELRRYRRLQILVAVLNYEGPALSAKQSVRLTLSLPNFGRGLAIHRESRWWTAPVFTTQPLNLPPNNQMLLWRLRRGAGYDRLGYLLLAPLAGDGLMGELGASHYRFRIAFSSQAHGWTPHRIPLFALGYGPDPYQLARRLYAAAFATAQFYGRLRWQKAYPEAYRGLGWCSWNAYQDDVSAQKVLDSVAALEAQHVRLGFVLVDDGWLDQRADRLEGFGALRHRFPGGLSGLASALHGQYHIRWAGVWHAFPGYWNGVAPDSPLGHTYELFAGPDGRYAPDPRGGAGESFYAAWYRQLSRDGINLLKVDDQASAPLFAGGHYPVYAFGEGEERNLQAAARQYFASPAASASSGADPGVNLLNCMDMSLENVYNWRYSNIARNSDDYVPGSLSDSNRHIFDNAYNAYWMSNFAWPDWDMFQTAPNDAGRQAIARAISGGPIYDTDAAGKARVKYLRALELANGEALRPDAPGEVTPTMLLHDPELEPLPLKLFAPIHRPGMNAEMIAAFNVNPTRQRVLGYLSADDAPDLGSGGMEGEMALAVYQRSIHAAVLLGPGARLPLQLGSLGADLFTVAPLRQGVAVFGLLNKYLGPAAVQSVEWQFSRVVVNLAQAGEFGAWLLRPPLAVAINGKRLHAGGYHYQNHLLTIPAASFPSAGQPCSVSLSLQQPD